MVGQKDYMVGQKDYKEWGVQGMIRQQTSADGRGLAFSLSPGYGDIGSSTNQLWQGVPESNSNSTDDYSARLNMNMSYGMFAPAGRRLLTLYSEVTLGNSKNYRLGLR